MTDRQFYVLIIVLYYIYVCICSIYWMLFISLFFVCAWLLCAVETAVVVFFLWFDKRTQRNGKHWTHKNIHANAERIQRNDEKTKLSVHASFMKWRQVITFSSHNCCVMPALLSPNKRKTSRYSVLPSEWVSFWSLFFWFRYSRKFFSFILIFFPFAHLQVASKWTSTLTTFSICRKKTSKLICIKKYGIRTLLSMKV